MENLERAYEAASGAIIFQRAAAAFTLVRYGYQVYFLVARAGKQIPCTWRLMEHLYSGLTY